MSTRADLLITGARIVNATHIQDGHIAVAGGKIAAVFGASTPAEDLPGADRVVDAGGRYVIPGGVDGHCHVEQVTGPYKSLDTFEGASIAALWGGTTTIIDFGIPADRSETTQHASENKIRLAKVARCDVALHGCVLDWDETTPAQLAALRSYGIRSLKVYTTNRNSTMADDDTIIQVMKEMSRLDGLVYVHAEHDPIIHDCTESHAAAGLTAVENLGATRPELSESASVEETLAMARYTGCPVYYVHQSNPDVVRLVQAARAAGQAAWSETCPHYMLLDEGVYASEHADRYACAPPIRSRASADGLLREMVLGHVDTISSDHSCYDTAQKASHREDMHFMPFGLPGVETRMPAAYTALVERGGMSLTRFADVFSAAPARINGLPTKGVIAAGYDADLVLFDPTHRRTVNGKELHMGNDYSPFDGMELAGWPDLVVSAGRIVLEDEEFADPGPVGQFLKRIGVREMAAAATPRREMAGVL